MMSEFAVNRMLVELDALVDTRYALFRRLDPEAASRMLRSGRYHARFTDHFWNESDKFTREDWEREWAKRDVSLLKESFLTEGIEEIKQAVANINWGMRQTDKKRVELVLNIAPYDLSPAVRQAYIDVLETELIMVTEVTTTSQPLWVLHPEDVAQRYDFLMIYNFHEWVAGFEHRFEQFEMGATLVMAPRLFKELPEKGTKEWKDLEAMDVFLFAEMRFFSRCELRFVVPASFSIPRELRLKKEESEKREEP